METVPRHISTSWFSKLEKSNIFVNLLIFLYYNPMDDLGVKSFKILREEKEYLSRELADACRDYIDLKCRHNEILFRYHIIKKTSNRTN
jgi:hypothetical protein